MKIHGLFLALFLLPVGPLAARTAVPLDLSAGFPVAEIMVGGKGPFAFIVDTGASDSVMDSEAAEAAGLVAVGSASGTAQGGEIEGQRLAETNLAVGDVVLPRVQLFALPLAVLSAGAGRPIHGILGYDLFRDHVVRFDYPRRRLVLDGGSGKGGTTIPIEVVDKTPFVAMDVTRNGRSLPARMLLDTGAVGAVTLNAVFNAAHPEILPDRSMSLTAGALLPGRFHARVGRLDSVRIGPFTLTRPVVNFSSNAQADDAAPGDSGLVGSDLLRRFVLTVDYGRSKIVLKPARNLREPFRFDRTGLSLGAVPPDLRMKKVRTVLPGSPAEAAGLMQGDEILEVDGKAAAALPLARIRRSFREGLRPYRLRVRRGERIFTVELRPRDLI